MWVWNGQWKRSNGTAAEYITLPLRQVVPLPENVSFITGAALGIPAITASYCVFSHSGNGDGNVKGLTILISGGGGTVGILAVQIARHAGAFVIATASPTHFQRVQEAGAHVVLDYTTPTTELISNILHANNGKLVDKIVEVEFGSNLEMNTAVIQVRGHIVTYGSSLNASPILPFYPLMFKGITIDFALIYLLTEQEHNKIAKRINNALINGVLTVPVHATYSLEECAQAHLCVEKGGRVGAVIVTIP